MRTIFTLLAALVIGTTSASFAAPKEKAPTAKKPAGVKYEGGDGSSMEKAVIIKGAKSSEDGVPAEYAWTAKKYPGYKMRRQSLRGDKTKRYDVLAITTKDGKEIEVWFDITAFFGKF